MADAILLIIIITRVVCACNKLQPPVLPKVILKPETLNIEYYRQSELEQDNPANQQSEPPPSFHVNPICIPYATSRGTGNNV